MLSTRGLQTVYQSNTQSNGLAMPQDNSPPPEIQGKIEAKKEKVKDEATQERKLGTLMEKADKVLLKIKCVFPFDLFPNEVTVDLNKVNIVYNYFLSKRIHSIAIKNISDVYMSSGIFFGSIGIVDTFYKGDAPIKITYLKKRDAAEARQVIQGLMACVKEDLNLSTIDVSKDKIESLGEAKGAE